MKRIVASFAALLALAGCGRDGADEFRNALPGQETVSMDAPATAGQALTAGQTSEFYELTRNTTHFVNGSTVLVLGTIKWITDHRPTTVEANKAIWGPYAGNNGDGLRRDNDWKLTVVKESPELYSYTVEAKAPGADDSAWVIVISGQHSPMRDAAGEIVPRMGEGSFLLDWNAAATLPRHDDNVGTAEVNYTRNDQGAHVTAHFEDVKDRANVGQTMDADYAYTHARNQGGTFDFKIAKDMGGGTNIETLAIRSRWLQSGAGRSDVIATGGDFAALDPVPSINECWDTSFVSIFQQRTYDTSATFNYGAETDCAFPTAEYSSL